MQQSCLGTLAQPLHHLSLAAQASLPMIRPAAQRARRHVIDRLEPRRDNATRSLDRQEETKQSRRIRELDEKVARTWHLGVHAAPADLGPRVRGSGEDFLETASHI